MTHGHDADTIGSCIIRAGAEGLAITTVGNLAAQMHTQFRLDGEDDKRK
jgi:hypothetical protein